MHVHFLPPNNEDFFETFCLAFLKRHWNNPRLEQYGVRGQRQFGVDIHDPSRRPPLHAAQCKNHLPHKDIKAKEIRDEVKKALDFRPRLQHYAILTTATAKREADDEVSAINAEHREKGLFTVEVMDWNEIQRFLPDYPSVADLLAPAQNSQLVALREEALSAREENRTAHQSLSSQITALHNIAEGPSFDTEIDQAQDFLDSHKPVPAEALFQKIRQRRWPGLSPTQKYRVLWGLSRICTLQGKDREAGKLLIAAKEVNPQDEKAQINEALGYEFLGESRKAHSIASALIVSYPSSGKLAACWVRTHEEEDPEQLKAELSSLVLDEAEVSVAFALKSINRNQFVQAQGYARAAISQNETWTGPHLLLGQAYLQEQVSHSQRLGRYVCDPAKLRDAINFLDRAVVLARQDQADYILAEALSCRGFAKALLDAVDEADADFEEATRIAPDDPGVLHRHSQYLRDRKEYDRCIKTIRKIIGISSSVERKHHLAAVLLERNRPEDLLEAAEIYLEIARVLLQEHIEEPNLLESDHGQTMLFGAFHTTMDDLIASRRMSDVDEFLAKIPFGRISDVALTTTKSKQSFAVGELEDARRIARDAIAAVDLSTTRVDLRSLAAHLMTLELYHDALPIWERICPPGIHTTDVRYLVRCAQQIDRLDIILKTSRALREADIDSPWLVHLELDILQDADPEKAITLLEEYLARHPENHILRFRLSLIVLDHRRDELVVVRPETIPDVSSVTPRTGSLVTNVLRRTGNELKAVEYAYALYRRFDDDPLACMALFTAVFAVDSPSPEIRQPERVELGSAVRYSEEGLADSWIVIEDSPQPNRGLDEYPPDDPLAVALIGKLVGDSFKVGHGLVCDRVGVVKEIISKYVYRARFVGETWQRRFHDQPWITVIRGRRTTSESGEDKLDVSEMLLAADRRYERMLADKADYQSLKIPLHVFAQNSGSRDFEAYLSITTQLDCDVLCWPGPPDEWGQAIGVLRTSPALVLDLSALATLYLLPDESILRNWNGPLIVSQNTLHQIQECLPPPPGHDRVHSRFGKTENGYVMEETSVALLTEIRDKMTGFISLLREKADVLGCESIVDLDPQKRHVFSKVLGQHGLENMLLAAEPGRALWSDDAILSMAARSEFGARCVWSQVAVMHGVQQGFLPPDLVPTVGAYLLGFGYKNIFITEHIMRKAAELAEWDPGKWPFIQAMKFLADPSVSTGQAGRHALELIVSLFDSVAFPPLRERVLITIAEWLRSRVDGIALVKALTRALPQRLGLNVVHSNEAVEVLLAWIAEASSRPAAVSGGLVLLPNGPA